MVDSHLGLGKPVAGWIDRKTCATVIGRAVTIHRAEIVSLSE